MAHYIIVKVGRRWAVVIDYGQDPHAVHYSGRQGFWCQDVDGKWAMSHQSARQALRIAKRPRTYAHPEIALEVIAGFRGVEIDHETVWA